MARTPVPSSHPDADLLTAFAENALGAKEHQQVVDHLSACAECRDIIFLAQPEAAQTQTVLAPQRRRFTWMAWASVGAVVAIVASAVIIQHEQVTKIETPAPVTTTIAPAAPEMRLDEIPLPAKNAPPAVAKDRENAPAGKATEVAKERPSASPLVIPKSEIAEETHMAAPAAAPAPIGTAQGGVVGGVVAQQNVNGPRQQNVANQMGQQANADVSVENAKIAQTPSAAVATKKQQVRREELHGVASGYVAGAAPIQPALQLAARAHWRISPTGTLERSYIADNWTPVLADPGGKFHVIAVLANTVWAGGEHGALYVSHDGGTNWAPAAINTTETITSIHFSDELHGTLQTADGLAWKTADGGKTWEKQ